MPEASYASLIQCNHLAQYKNFRITDDVTVIHFRLQRFEKTNAMLTNCNALSAQRLQNTTVDFKRHVQMLTDMKKDLNQVFERIRKLKTKLANQYPKQFAGKKSGEGRALRFSCVNTRLRGHFMQF